MKPKPLNTSISLDMTDFLVASFLSNWFWLSREREVKRQGAAGDGALTPDASKVK